ncbi:hypothetical protein PRZ48_010979 [Zasmidium cellare]|uniref:SnoaL-like domain-containing protein n=1 Tax=Zasmidium cellare TaxID=395010 RepID=A0ABR0EAQ8_ZASCE|nr:hypothetical protein PRZ48_010979 [Zasmidium cellare]
MHVDKPKARATAASKEKDRIAAELEDILSSIVDAINTRDFNPAAYPWTCMDENYRMIAAGAACVAKNKTEFLDGFRDYTSAHPSVRSEIVSMDTHVYAASGYAEIYVNVQNSGGPDVPLELKQMTVGVQEFRCVEGGKWFTVGQTTIMGLKDEFVAG